MSLDKKITLYCKIKTIFYFFYPRKISGIVTWMLLNHPTLKNNYSSVLILSFCHTCMHPVLKTIHMDHTYMSYVGFKFPVLQKMTQYGLATLLYRLGYVSWAFIMLTRSMW